MTGYAYLASPYSHPDPDVRFYRFQRAVRAAAKLMLAGETIFSPIAHSHPIDLEFLAPKDGTFWMGQDIPILRHASSLKVLMLDGWKESKGIALEIEIATAMRIPVEFIVDDVHVVKPEELPDDE